jgi:hypothetical protein
MEETVALEQKNVQSVAWKQIDHYPQAPTGTQFFRLTNRRRFQLPKLKVVVVNKDQFQPSVARVSLQCTDDVERYMKDLKHTALKHVPNMNDDRLFNANDDSSYSNPVKHHRSNTTSYPPVLSVKCDRATIMYIEHGNHNIVRVCSPPKLSYGMKIIVVVSPLLWIVKNRWGIELQARALLVFPDHHTHSFAEGEPDDIQADHKQQPALDQKVTRPVDNSQNLPSVTASNVYLLSDDCAVCMDAKAGAILLPCAHMCMCFKCATQIFDGASPSCPVCRTKIVQVAKIQ